MSKVHVVMGNDFPDAVFANKDDAENYAAAKKIESDTNVKKGYGGRIYWRVYSFPLIAKKPALGTTTGRFSASAPATSNPPRKVAPARKPKAKYPPGTVLRWTKKALRAFVHKGIFENISEHDRMVVENVTGVTIYRGDVVEMFSMLKTHDSYVEQCGDKIPSLLFYDARKAGKPDVVVAGLFSMLNIHLVPLKIK